MSDTMLFGVLRMPYEMAMADELSRRQFYERVQEALQRMGRAEHVIELLVAAGLVTQAKVDEAYAISIRTEAPTSLSLPSEGEMRKEMEE